MSRPTGPTNTIVKKLVDDIRSKGHKEKIPFLLEVADKLETSRRSKPQVNLSRLDRVCKENEFVVVPGKVLSSGVITKPLNIAAANFSMAAAEKVQKAGGKTMTISELVEKNPKGTGVRIVV